MKILKKPKLLPVECKRCGCLFQPKIKDLQALTSTAKDEVACPVCKRGNRANFDIKPEEQTQ